MGTDARGPECRADPRPTCPGRGQAGRSGCSGQWLRETALGQPCWGGSRVGLWERELALPLGAQVGSVGTLVEGQLPLRETLSLQKML